MSYDEAQAILDAGFAEDRLDTNQRFRDGRNANTVAAYNAKAKEWKKFCDAKFSQLPIERKYTMNQDKLHSWLKDDLLTRKTKNSKGEDKEDGSPLSYSTVYSYVAGAVSIWSQQKEDQINTYPHPAPRDGHVKKLLILRSQAEASRRRTEYIDRGQGTFLDTFQLVDLVRCNDHCLTSGTELQSRDRLALNLSFSLLLRGHSARNAELADFFPMNLPNESTESVTAVCMVIDVDKTNHNGAKNLMGAMRHLDFRLCTHNAIAMYFFERFHVSGETFPDLNHPKRWYDIKLLLSRGSTGNIGRTNALSYQQHLATIDAMFKACNIRSKAKTHASRRSGAQNAEIHGVPELQIRRAGRWNASVMESTYLTHLPRKFMRVGAGSVPEENSYFCARNLIQPPEDVVALLFPDVDHYLAIESTLPDLAAAGLVRMLDYLRRVLAQDVVFLQRDFPNHPIGRHEIFQSSSFKTFGEQLLLATQQTPNPATLRLQQLAPALSVKMDEVLLKVSRHEAAAIERENIRDQRLETSLAKITERQQTGFNMNARTARDITAAIGAIQQNTVRSVAQLVVDHSGNAFRSKGEIQTDAIRRNRSNPRGAGRKRVLGASRTANERTGSTPHRHT